MRDGYFGVALIDEDGRYAYGQNRRHERVLRRRLGLETHHEHVVHANTYVAARVPTVIIRRHHTFHATPTTTRARKTLVILHWYYT